MTPDEPAKPYDIDPASERPSPDPKPKIDQPPLTADFPKDADFDRDPELDRILQGAATPPAKRPRRTASPGTASPDTATPSTDAPSPHQPPTEDFVKPGFGEPIHWAAAAGLLTIAALVVTGINAQDKHVWRILLTLYLILFHAGTGLVAVYIAAALERKYVGRIDLAAARMFTAVAAFALVFSIAAAPFGHRALDAATNLALAAIAYLAVVVLTFRLWTRQTLGILVGVHFLLWLLVQLAIELAAVIARTT